MKLHKSLTLFIAVLVASPVSFIVGNEILANHLSERFDYEVTSNNLIACGGGGGGGKSPAAKAAKKAQQARAKITFKKRQLSKLAAEGESTAELEAEIAELEALLEE